MSGAARVFMIIFLILGILLLLFTGFAISLAAFGEPEGYEVAQSVGPIAVGVLVLALIMGQFGRPATPSAPPARPRQLAAQPQPSTAYPQQQHTAQPQPPQRQGQGAPADDPQLGAQQPQYGAYPQQSQQQAAYPQHPQGQGGHQTGEQQPPLGGRHREI